MQQQECPEQGARSQPRGRPVGQHTFRRQAPGGRLPQRSCHTDEQRHLPWESGASDTRGITANICASSPGSAHPTQLSQLSNKRLP